MAHGVTELPARDYTLDALTLSRNQLSSDILHFQREILLVAAFLLPACSSSGGHLGGDKTSAPVAPGDVFEGLRSFYARTYRPDGSFAPGLDPDYLGMSDSAYSDLAPATYAVVVHKTFG